MSLKWLFRSQTFFRPSFTLKQKLEKKEITSQAKSESMTFEELLLGDLRVFKILPGTVNGWDERQREGCWSLVWSVSNYSIVYLDLVSCVLCG